MDPNSRAALLNGGVERGGGDEQELRRCWCSQLSDLSVVQLPVHVDLPLRDVARQVRDGVGDVCGGRRTQQGISSTRLLLKDLPKAPQH